ncbi:MAG TPA: hypothetical protein VNO30_43135 [Kofleriaceae bacterium]|nr:hypothetical protein [Kofleriaceae bacterium]
MGPGEQGRGHIEAGVSEQTMDVRVDWSGSTSSLGRFEVRVSSGEWHTCGLFDAGSSNDVVSPAKEVTGDVFMARFQRGPEQPLCLFGVKAVPIVWNCAIDELLNRDFVAERGMDYDYEEGANPKVIPWTYSVLAGGAQKLTIELTRGRDYEVWVRLQSPRDPNGWLEQDPVIRTTSGGGNPH